MNWVKLAKSSTLCLGLLLLVTSCRSQPGNQPGGVTTSSGSGDGRITIGTTQEPRTLDPADAYELRSLNLVYNMSDRLYAYAPGTTNLEPELATALPKVTPDALTYTITLRQGVVFHDGTPLTAKVMADSLLRFRNNGGQPAFLLKDIVDTIQATSDTELKIKLKKPFSAFPALLAFIGTCPVSPKEYQIGEGKFIQSKFTGTGPYKLTSYGTDSVRFDLFDQYWGTKPVNKGVNWRIYKSSANNLFNAFKRGEIDVAYFSLEPTQIRSLEQEAKQGKIQAISSPGTTISYMMLNVKQKPLDNPLVRQAIASFINRQLINERVLFNQAEPLYSTIPTSFDVSLPLFKEKYGDANIEKAKQLLQQAGFSATNPAKLQIWYPSGSPTRQKAANLLAEYAKQQMGGILEFEVKTDDGAIFFSNKSKGVYPITLLDWYPDFLDADNYVQPFLECPKGSVTGGCQEGGSKSQGSFYYNPKMNQLIDSERKELNPETRKKIFADIQNLIAQDVPLIPLWQTKDYVFAQKGVAGVQINATQTLPYSPIKK
ncbi:ABC transporter substrate-binding protein [Merismopedia glauca]|uniref:Peptide ABC transporter substrate-binding protein n=1 Tax=Merismopedia glauca CCAP 1448/3 TaxID=1296344 RepID=A0A2T1C300_9CYAN|nr:ABC transporter substrate-binding protein [Merismopedia glauca]PSB02493.1 peptide ABC transporter substrate-binding protein [Merismopedia glauca CCAP 1448/3]